MKFLGEGDPLRARNASRKVAVIYAVAAGMWILFSDRVLLWYLEDPTKLTQLQTVKGWFFVFSTAVMLAWLVRHFTRRSYRERDLLESIISNIPLYVYWKGRDGRYLGCNQGFADLAGAGKKGSICGKADHELAWREGEAELIRQSDRQVMEKREALLDVEEVQRQIKGKETVLLTSKVPLVDESGNVTGMLGICADITQRKQSEEALRESELFYRQTLQSIPGMVFTTRPDGYCDYQSQQWVDFTGVPMNEHLGDGWNKLLHPDDRPRAFAAWRAAVEERAPYDLEYRVRRHDGEYEWFKVRGRPIRNEAGEIVRWFGTALNIDQLVRAQEELNRAKAAAEEATRTKSEFLANMSHEIRTPMTVFLAALEYLLQIDSDSEHRHLLEIADKSAKRLRALIDDILDFSRIEARRVELREKPFDLRACVREAVEIFALPAREKNLRLETHVAPDLPHIIVGDPCRLGQVLANLVGNAVKFTHEGEVRVSVQARNSLLEFSVADTGIGIPADKLHLLFQNFTQMDASFQRRYGGSGLGLAISKGLVDLMGGRINVQSRAGVGSIFSFTLPLKAAESLSLSSPEARSEDPGGESRTVRILLAEDEPMIREAITIILKRRGWHIETAESGRDAVQKWERGGVDILLMDLQMPEMNGLEATERIRTGEAGRGKRTCIIGLTAHAHPKIKDDCLKAGMDKVLIKPFQMDALYSAIDSCLLE